MVYNNVYTIYLVMYVYFFKWNVKINNFALLFYLIYYVDIGLFLTLY